MWSRTGHPPFFFKKREEQVVYPVHSLPHKSVTADVSPGGGVLPRLALGSSGPVGGGEVRGGTMESTYPERHVCTIVICSRAFSCTLAIFAGSSRKCLPARRHPPWRATRSSSSMDACSASSYDRSGCSWVDDCTTSRETRDRTSWSRTRSSITWAPTSRICSVSSTTTSSWMDTTANRRVRCMLVPFV
jgi:hypothetical protein